MMNQAQREDHKYLMMRKTMRQLWNLVKTEHPDWTDRQIAADLVSDLKLPNLPQTYKQRKGNGAK